MRRSPKILIASTHSDDSLRYFFQSGVETVFFEDETKRFADAVRAAGYDIIYIRDPFNTGVMPLESILPKIEVLTSRHPGAYYVDGVNDREGLLVEDKWLQYQIWEDLMPRTSLGGTAGKIPGSVVAKKRISARSRDILFDPDESVLTSDWIVQERLAITEELRVYGLFGEVVRLASKRQSHKQHEPTRAVGLRMLSDEEHVFAQEVILRKNDLDFVGLDIVVTREGLRLIEINRSPQFNRHNQISGTNLVADFWKTIREKTDQMT